MIIILQCFFHLNNIYLFYQLPVRYCKKHKVRPCLASKKCLYILLKYVLLCPVLKISNSFIRESTIFKSPCSLDDYFCNDFFSNKTYRRWRINIFFGIFCLNTVCTILLPLLVSFWSSFVLDVDKIFGKLNCRNGNSIMYVKI